MRQTGPHSYTDIGTGPPVICLHGIGGDDRAFAPMGDHLAQHARVIAWNFPGYRNSTPIAPLTFEALTLALDTFLDALDLPNVTLIGHSIGGMLAQEAALRLPKRVTRLVLIGTTPAFGGRDDSFKTAFLKDRLAPLDAGQSMADMAAQAAPHLVGPDASADVIAQVAQTIADTPEPTWRAILKCLVTFNRRADQPRITQPSLLIAGGHDRNAPAKSMAKMAENLPDAAYACIDSAGHMIQMEAPAQTTALITNFLDETS